MIPHLYLDIIFKISEAHKSFRLSLLSIFRHGLDAWPQNTPCWLSVLVGILLMKVVQTSYPVLRRNSTHSTDCM